MTTAPNPNELIGTDERNAAVSTLSQHLAAGRLNDSEFQDRSAQITAARTRGDIDAVFTDLPQDVPPVLPPYEDPTSRGPVAGRPSDSTVTHAPDTSSPTGGTAPPQVQRWLAISGSLSVIAFFFLGFAFGAWAWAWVVFLVPGMVRAFYGLPNKGCDG